MADDFSELERDFPEVVEALRSGPLPNPKAEAPSEELWQAISFSAARKQSGTSPFPDGANVFDRDEAPTSWSTPTAPVYESPAAGNDAVPQDSSNQPTELDTSVTEIRSRRVGRSVAIAFAAAAAVLLVALPLALGIVGGRSSGLDGAVELAVLGSSVADGQATLEGRTLTVGIEDLEAAPQSSTYELWLLEVDVDGNPVEIEWIGSVDDAESINQTFEIPGEIDTNTYTVVDVSIEPDDGDLTHSGNSVLRGDLAQS